MIHPDKTLQQEPRSESYLHEHAKYVVREWWFEKDYFGIVPVRIDIEVQMSMVGKIIFIPDVAIYDAYGIRAFCEIFNKHAVDDFKIWKMHKYGEWHDVNALIIEVDATWVMKQVNPPDVLVCKILSDFSSTISARIVNKHEL